MKGFVTAQTVLPVTFITKASPMGQHFPTTGKFSYSSSFIVLFSCKDNKIEGRFYNIDLKNLSYQRNSVSNLENFIDKII